MILPNLFNINDKSILATASITITDQTDVANLIGGISIVKGTKNQVYLTGSSTPFSPDWEKDNLVLRPYVYASTVTKGDGLYDSYNPDFFDPKEYPNLDNPNDGYSTVPYINKDTIAWFVRDANGAERIIDPEKDSRFIFNYTTQDTQEIFTDKRFLVIRGNIVPTNSFLTIICRFSFYDPFAKMNISQSYEIDLSCLSTGSGSNRLIINRVNGTSIYNSAPEHIDLFATFFRDGVEVNVQEELRASEKNSTLRWYIRSADGAGWTFLDGEKQDENDNSNLYEVRYSTSLDPDTHVYTTEKEYSKKGGFWLRVHPALIQGSEVIKAVFYSQDDKREFSALEIVYDTTDDVQAYIYSSNGDKIYQGVKSLGTELTCMLKYQGKVLDTNDEKYETHFEYYWFKVSSDGRDTWNVWLDASGKLNQQLVTEDNPVEMKSSSRVLPIHADDVDHVNMFQCAVVNKMAMALEEQRSNYILNSPSEEDIKAASIFNSNLGIEDNDIDSLMNTAYEINAFNISNGTSFKN